MKLVRAQKDYNSLAFSLVAFALYGAMNLGIYLADLSRAYFDTIIDEKVQERLADLSKKGKPVYCSLFKGNSYGKL